MPTRRSPLKGGRRTAEEKTRSKCEGEEDPISSDVIDPKRAIRLLQNGKYFCFDVVHLSEWLKVKNTNPSTRQPFTADQLAKVQKKFNKLYQEKFTELVQESIYALKHANPSMWSDSHSQTTKSSLSYIMTPGSDVEFHLRLFDDSSPDRELFSMNVINYSDPFQLQYFWIATERKIFFEGRELSFNEYYEYKKDKPDENTRMIKSIWVKLMRQAGYNACWE